MRDTTTSLASKLATNIANQAGELASRILNSVNDRGYNEAAAICLGVLDREINVLDSRMRNRDFLSDTDQTLLAHLTELRSVMARKLRDPDDGAAVEATSNRFGGTNR